MKHLYTLEKFINDQNTNDTDHFKIWFGDSVMIDSEGNPIIFYHGSNEEFDDFDDSKIGSATDPGWLGTGFYFYTDIHEAKQYGKVSSYYLRIEEPYFATDQDNEYLADENSIEASNEFTQNLIAEGYDGVSYNGNLRGETVVFKSSQIWKIK